MPGYHSLPLSNRTDNLRTNCPAKTPSTTTDGKGGNGEGETIVAAAGGNGASNGGASKRSREQKGEAFKALCVANGADRVPAPMPMPPPPKDGDAAPQEKPKKPRRVVVQSDEEEVTACPQT